MNERKVLGLDSWPILEWVYGHEPAATSFEELMVVALKAEVDLQISWINFGEVIYSIKRELSAQDAQDSLDRITSLPIAVISVGDALVREAAESKATTKLSYGRVCRSSGFATQRSPRDRRSRVQAVSLRLKLRLLWLGA